MENNHTELLMSALTGKAPFTCPWWDLLTIRQDLVMTSDHNRNLR